MATERLSMRKTREILRQKWVLGRSHREVVQSLGVSLGVVTGALKRAAAAGLSWPEVEQLADDEPEGRLYATSAPSKGDRPMPDPVWIHLERKKPGVTLELLHLEYLERHPNGYRYTAFCDVYRKWLKRHRLSMRQPHRAGDKLFVDYSGKKPSIVDPQTGEVTPVELFVAVLGASNYTYAEATLSQKSVDWIASHTRALEYFEGVPLALVPDQLKSGVIEACRYEPKAQRTLSLPRFGGHRGGTAVPWRSTDGKEKAVHRGIQEGRCAPDAGTRYADRRGGRAAGRGGRQHAAPLAREVRLRGQRPRRAHRERA